MGTSLPEIKIKGWNALVKELGHSGATKFILMCEKGAGDYTKDRKKMLKGLMVDKIVKDISASEA